MVCVETNGCKLLVPCFAELTMRSLDVKDTLMHEVQWNLLHEASAYQHPCSSIHPAPYNLISDLHHAVLSMPGNMQHLDSHSMSELNKDIQRYTTSQGFATAVMC